MHMEDREGHKPGNGEEPHNAEAPQAKLAVQTLYQPP